MPVRRIPRSRSCLTGRHAVASGGSVGFESSLERDFVTLMEFSPEVIGIEEQPVRIDVPGKSGRAAHYVPDFLVSRRELPALLVEVKRARDLAANREKYSDKFAAAQAFAAARGWEFHLFVERDIRTPRLANARFLRPFRSPLFDQGLCAELLAGFGRRSMTVAALADAPRETERARRLACVWHLVATGRLRADLDRPLSADTAVAPPPRAGRDG